MATARSSNRNCSSGGVIAGGRFRLPAWRRSIAPGTWGTVGGHTLSEINPDNNPAINPNHPGSAPWRANSGFSAIIAAWCGACYDDIGCNLWFPLQGGHSDYSGNEPYKIHLWDDAPSFHMLRNPSGAVGNTGVLNDGLESSGVYFDGRRRSVHSYNKAVYVPGYGPLIAVQGNTSYTAAGGTLDSLLLDEATGEMSTLGTNANPGAATSGGGACYDSLRGRVYWIGVGTGRLTYLIPESGEWALLPGGETANEWGTQSLTYVPSIDRILQINTGLSGLIAVWNPATGERTMPGTTGVGSIGLDGKNGAAWCDSLGCILCWHNSSDTTLITTLTPPATSPETSPWSLGILPVSQGNTVTPTACQENGTYGRFFVSKKLGAAIILNAVDQPLYAYALE